LTVFVFKEAMVFSNVDEDAHPHPKTIALLGSAQATVALVV
jgi:hypothetical protein